MTYNNIKDALIIFVAMTAVCLALIVFSPLAIVYMFLASIPFLLIGFITLLPIAALCKYIWGW